MKEKIIKTIVIQMIGLMLAQIMVLTYNPIGIAYFSVAYVLSPYRILTFPLMLISMGTRMGLVDVSKYAMVMLVIVACNGMYELKKKKIHVNSLAAITGVAILCMEIADTLMITYDYKGIIISFFVGVLSAMLTLVFYKGVLTIKNAKINSMLKNEEMISIAIITGLVWEPLLEVHAGWL